MNNIQLNFCFLKSSSSQSVTDQWSVNKTLFEKRKKMNSSLVHIL